MRKVKEKNEKKREWWLIIFLLFLVIVLSVITVTYTFNAKIIDIVGFTGVYREASWKVDFDNIRLDRMGSIYVQDVSASNTSIKDFDITFIKPGDAFTIKMDVVNNGTIDAKLETFKVSDVRCTYDTGLSADDYCSKYVDYYIRYLDGSNIKKDDVLKAGESKTIIFKMEYSEVSPILYDDVINIDGMNINFVYVQK